MNHEISFWKQKKRTYVIFFCVCIIKLQSCDLTVYVALELCSRFLQTWIFFWMRLKGIKKSLKWGALECNHVAVRNSSQTRNFSQTRYIVKTGKLFASDDSYPNQNNFFSAGFFVGIFYLSENLNTVWATNSYSFSFIFWLSCMDYWNDIKRLFHE